MSLLDRIQTINANALPVAADRRSVLLGIEGDDVTVGYLQVTGDETGDGATIVIYDFDDWQRNQDPLTALAVESEDATVAIVEYLVTMQPEGTDWAAWACQRIDDDGVHCADDAPPAERPVWIREPDENLAIQWQDSAPDMDYDDWLKAEIDIQLELLEDVPDDDYVGKAASYTYIVDIQDEIRRRAQ